MGIKAIILIQLIIVILASLIDEMGVKAFIILLMMCIEMFYLYNEIWGRKWK